jgi:hypothetical protein
MYVFLNCLTLGVYGVYVSSSIGREINALCKDDGEEPYFGYGGACLIRGIAPFLGIVIGLIVGLVNASAANSLLSYGFGAVSLVGPLGLFLGGGLGPIAVFSSILVFGVIFTVIGTWASGMYLNYWWYKQANRLKLNAWRYDLVVKERGTDNFLFRTALEILFLPATILLFALTMLIPNLIGMLCLNVAGNPMAAIIVITVFTIPVLFTAQELTSGAYFSQHFIFKNLNRFSDAARNGAKPFDPMAYEYYPSADNHYIQFLPGFVSGAVAPTAANPDADYGEYHEAHTTPLSQSPVGSVTGLNGTCAGYEFNLTGGEEIIIGKDAKVASIVIDTSYKEISRKHVGIGYDVARDVYRVTDYSSNGTWANNQKLSPGVESIQGRGTILKLANDKNTFRLG